MTRPPLPFYDNRLLFGRAGVPGHLHYHLLPRWNGDSNFMTTAAQVRVIPQALEELHGELQKALRHVR